MRSVASSALFLAALVISACIGGPGAPAATGAPASAAATTKAFQGTKDLTVAFSPIGVSSVADLSYLEAVLSELGRK